MKNRIGSAVFAWSAGALQLCRGAAVTLAVSAVFSFLGQRSAFALQPGDRTALGVPQQDNAPLHGGGTYQHPLGGFYYLLSAIPQYPTPVWLLLPQAPPGVRDPMVGNAILQPIGYVTGKGHFAKIKGTQAGWVKVEVWQNGVLKDWAYYALYDIATIEDQKGGTVPPNTQYKGYDPRYGWLGPDFLEEGGFYYFQGLSEPPAESMFGFDDRYEGAGTAWTGQPSVLNPPVRVARWMPQSQLLPSSALQTDSIMANGRDCQHLRLWLHGPSDSSVTVPIHVHCYSIASGEVEPGRPGPYPDPNRYDISYVPWGGGVGGFIPPDLYIQGQPPGAPGQWQWPGGVSHDPAPSEDLAVKRHSFRDPPPFPGATRIQRNWILTVPLKGKSGTGGPLLSGSYADIEIEARIPTQANVAFIYGDPNWPDEGVMQFRWGTVIGLKKIEVRPEAPETEANLKQYWYRRVQYELKYPVCDPDECTLAFAAKAVAGTTDRTDDPARIEVKADGTGTPAAPPPVPMPPYAEPYFKEINVSTVNQKLVGAADPFPWSHWTEARWPEDARGHWLATDGSTTKPESVCLKYRGYVGVIQRTPAAIDFDDEIREYEDKPAQGAPPDANTPITKKVPVHFINVVGDVNNDGLWDADDEDEDCEEGDNAPGMLVNCDIMGNTPNLAVDDANARKVRLLLSRTVAGADYTDYKVVIRSEGALAANLNFWKDVRHQARWEYEPSLDGWVVTLDAGGADVDIYLGCVLGGPATTLQFFLLHHLDTDEDVPEALDELYVTFTKFGIDVDSDNSGTINDDDDMAEEIKPGLVTLLSEPAKTNGYDLHITKHPNLADVRSPKAVTLLKEGAGTIRILTDGGAEFLGASDTSTDFDVADVTGSGFLSYKILPQTKGEVTLKLRLTSDGRTLALDWLRLAVVAVDARISNGLENWSGGQSILEPTEESGGAVTVANLNDTDENGTLDRDDIGSVTGERDLMRFVMVKPDPVTDVFSEVRVRIEAGDIRAYNNSEKQTRIDPLTLGINGFNEAGSTEKTWWLEARAASASARDIDIRYEGHVVNSNVWMQLDRVRATAVWFTQAATGDVWYQSTQTTKPSPISTALDNFLEAWRSNGGAYYGSGLFGADWSTGSPAHGDSYIGGRILERWTLSPADVLSVWPNLRADTTRQVESRTWFMFKGAHAFQVDPNTLRNFPTDLDEANDDSTTGDPAWEDDELTTDAYVYNYDTPGIPIGEAQHPFGASATGPFTAFAVDRMNARAFVRVTLDGSSGGNGSSGSRASNHALWHTEQYSRCGLNGWLAPDTASPSYCEPSYSWTGPRTVTITAGNTTCGFTVFHYNLEPFTDQNGNGTWDSGEPYTDHNGNGAYDASPYWVMVNSLDGTSAWSSSGTPSLTSHGTTVAITGATGVPHGAWLIFSVFNSQRPASPGTPAGTKVQNIALGIHTYLLGAQ